MVKQLPIPKTSSRNNRKRSAFEFPAHIEGACWLPATLDIAAQKDPEGSPGFVISGTLTDDPADQETWREAPHVVFANLRVDDSQSVKAFIEKYGILHREDRIEIEGGERFSFDSYDLKSTQLLLRSAWEAVDVNSVESLEAYVAENISADVVVQDGYIELRAEDLWTLICFMFLRDYWAGKHGVCENPDCPSPYFRKKRRTQKFCEAGPCVAFANRRYALKWWNSKGKKRRRQQATKRHNKTRKKR